MSNVLIDQNKLDILATAISNKSGEPLKMTLAEMVEAVDGIEGGITPTGNIDITGAGVTDVTNYATATVPQGEINVSADTGFYTQYNVYRWHFRPFANIKTSDYAGKVGFLADNYYKAGNNQIFSAIASGTSVTPTETAQSIGGAEYMMEGAVTVNAIPSNYVGSGIAQRSSSDLTASGATVTVPSGYYSAQASKAVASGTAGTPTATKGAVSNHSVSVTPSVTNQTGYITGSTKTGTAVTVSASELVSGSETKTANGTYDVTNLASLVVNVSGGSSMNIQVAQSTNRATSSTYTSVISLTCTTAGKYDIYWDCFRSSTGGTNGSQLYIGGQAYGTANTVFTNHAQNNHLTGVTLAANQTVTVYARSRGSNYYAYVGTLIIKQTS